jgi:uncharacterized protein YhbP (UPF0306 family)
MSEESLASRSFRLLDEAKYLTLATVSPEGLAWSSVLQYAWLGDPLRLLFGSAVESRHSRHITTQPQVSGSLFVMGSDAETVLTSVDGAQFTGRCSEMSIDDLERFYTTFYEAVLPDPEARAEWMLPRSELRPPAPHRLYVIEVERWWLVDTRTWAKDRIDRRIEMPLAELAS